MVVMLHLWEEAQEGDLWLSCCIRTASMGGGSGGRPVVVMLLLHQDCISQEGDQLIMHHLWLSWEGGGSGG